MPETRRVESIVARQLGVRREDLAPDASLRDDLAADSLALLELGAALEEDLGVHVPEQLLDDVQTVGELINATLKLAHARRAAAAPGLLDEEPVRVRARITPSGGRSRITQGGWLTPYVLQQLLDTAVHAGRGAQVEVTLEAGASPSAVGRVLAVLRPLETAGRIGLDVRRDGEGGGRRGPATA